MSVGSTGVLLCGSHWYERKPVAKEGRTSPVDKAEHFQDVAGSFPERTRVTRFFIARYHAGCEFFDAISRPFSAFAGGATDFDHAAQ